MEIKLCTDGRGCKNENVGCSIGANYKLINQIELAAGCSKYEEKSLYPEKIIFEFTGEARRAENGEYYLFDDLIKKVNLTHTINCVPIYRKVE